MSLTNPNTPVSQQDLQDFYHKILPYMGGSSTGGGGHTIEDAEGTDLTQRDTLQFGEGFLAEDDDTNGKTVVSPDVMQSGDMSDVITPLPSVQPRYQKYSTEEQIVGEWIDGKPIYQKTYYSNTAPSGLASDTDYTLIPVADLPVNIDMSTLIIDESASFIKWPSNDTRPVNTVNKNTVFYIQTISAASVGIVLATSHASGVKGYAITLRYTKTTD